MTVTLHDVRPRSASRSAVLASVPSAEPLPHDSASVLVWRRNAGSCAQRRSWTLERPRLAAVPTNQLRTLLGAPWLADVSVPAREALSAALDVVELRAGDRAVHQGAQATCWYGVVSGAVRLSSLSASGRQLTFAMVAPGEWFGDCPLMGGMAEPCSAHAQVDSTLVSLRQDALQRLTRGHADLRYALLCWSASRQRAWMQAVLEASTAPLAQRLAARLLDLGRRFGQPQGDGFALTLSLTQNDLAQFVATSRQRLNEGLQDLRRAGVLGAHDGPITVLSTEALRQRARSAWD